MDEWTKSSRSSTDISCVEWKKSTKSGPHTDNCVEVGGEFTGDILIRDSKDPDGPILRFTPDEWTAFIGGVKDGEFDL